MTDSVFAPGSLVTVSLDWLEACGFRRFAGCPFEVVRVRKTLAGDFLELLTPAGTPWTVWEERGVEPYVAPVAMVPQPAQLQQARAARREPAPSVDRPVTVSETADERDAANLRNAASFSASIRAEGQAQTIDGRPTLVEAGATALLLERKAGNGRKACVYAVTERGASSLVPRATWIPVVVSALRALEDTGC